MIWRRAPESPQRYTACTRSCTSCSATHWPKDCLLNSWAAFLVPLVRCHLETHVLQYSEIDAVDYFHCLSTPHRPSRISRLSITFEIVLASFRPATPFLQYYTHLHFSQRYLYKENVSRKVRISKMLLYIPFRTHKRLLQSASVY